MSPTASAKPAKRKKRELTCETWEHPKGSGIKIAKKLNRTGGVVYGYSYQIRIPGELLGKPGKREFFQRKTKEEAEEFAEARYAALRQHGHTFADIPPAAQGQVIAAWAILQPHGITFVEAAEAAVKMLRPAGGDRSVAQVLAELKLSKETRFNRGELRERSWHDYKTRSAKIETAFGARLIKTITQTELAAWLRKIGADGLGDGALGARSVKNYRACVSELFRYAAQKDYCHTNPMAKFTRAELAELGGRKNKRARINILTVEEAQQLLVGARDHMEGRFLPSVILRLFCGLRTEEIVRCEWHDVRWQEAEPFVHIGEDKAKGRATRNVTIPPNALEWITLCAKKEGRISPRKNSSGYCRSFNRLQRLANLGKKDPLTGKWTSTWETNDTRHSFGSYHHAAHGNSTLTATEMGHKQGDSILFKHYRQLTTKAEGRRYFSLVPNATVAEPIQFEPVAMLG